MMDDATFYLVAAYAVASTTLQAMRLAAAHAAVRRIGTQNVLLGRVVELLETDLDIEVELEEDDDREFASSA